MRRQFKGYRLLALILVLATIFGLASSTWAAVDRVATLDALACDLTVGQDEAYTSIQSAINDALSGQTICVYGGEYHEAVEIKKQKTGLTLIAMPGEQPIIDGQKHLPGGAAGDLYKALLEVKGEGTTIDGFEIRFSSARGLDVTASNVIVRNTRVHDNWSTGINVNGAGSLTNILIEDNSVYMNMRRSQHFPVVYKGARTGTGSNDWTFDPDSYWDVPFWSGAYADLPEQWLNGLSMTFNDDGHTDRIYAGSARAGRAGNIGANYSANGQPISYSGADILFHEPSTNKWTLFFDGEPQGIPAGSVIDAFQIESTAPISEPWDCPTCAPILLSFTGTVTIPVTQDILTPTVTQIPIGPSDLVYFRPQTMADGRITSGYYTIYKQAADLIGLPEGANIDALDRAPDGRLLISTSITHTLTNPDGSTVIAAREDLVAYDEETGYWSLFFEGDQIPYNPFQGEDLTAAWVDLDGNIYISGNPVGGSALTFIRTSNSIARGNIVYNNFGEGLVIDRGSINSTAEANVLYDNRHANLYLNSTTNSTVRNNLVFCTEDQRFWRKGSGLTYGPAPGIQIRDEVWAGEDYPLSSGYTIVNNIVYGCSTNFGVSSKREGGGLNNSLVANNTFAHARGESASGYENVNFNFNGGLSVSGSYFVNNLLIQAPSLAYNVRIQSAVTPLDTFFVGHNLYSPNLDKISNQWPSDEPGRVVTADPKLENAALSGANPPLPVMGAPLPDPADFRPTFDSPAFAAGLPMPAVIDDFTGRLRDTVGTPDIGAFELPHQGIIVTNALVPADDPQLFDFNLSSYGTFQLGNGGTRTFVLPPGISPLLSTNVPAGWRQTAAACDNQAPPDAIPITEEDWTTCSFTHERLGSIIIRKETIPANDAQRFDFTSDFAGTFSLAHGEQQATSDLPTDIYAVSESLPDSWAQLDATCDDGSSPDAIDLAAGETVICTFTNARMALESALTPTPGAVTSPGGEVSFTVQITNDGGAAIVLESLSDSYLGDVAAAGNPALLATTCSLPQALPPDGSYECAYTANIGGPPDSTYASTLTVTGNGPGDLPASATAGVSIPILPPPPGRIIVIKQTDPPNAPGTFDFTASYAPGGFSLSHGQSHDSGPLPSGMVYNVAETVASGWTQVSAICAGDDDGNDPANIFLDPGETVTCTFVNTPEITPPHEVFYITTPKAGKVRAISYSPGDILAYDSVDDSWSLYFDASQVGITKALNDFVLMDDGSILLVFKAKIKLPNQSGKLQTYDPQDVVRFVPAQAGNLNAGWFEFYFDGSDVGLTTAGEKIDALAWLNEGPNGTLLISTTGTATVKDKNGGNLKVQKEDLLAFKIGQPGEATDGEWRLYFDGTPMQGMKAENLTSAYVDEETGTLYLTVMNAFTIKGVKGKNQTVLAISPISSTGNVGIFWVSANAGFAKPIDGFHITP